MSTVDSKTFSCRILQHNKLP